MQERRGGLSETCMHVPSMCTVQAEQLVCLGCSAALLINQGNECFCACRAILAAKPTEEPQQFQQRVRREGPAMLQTSMWHVHTMLERMRCWQSWTQDQQKNAMWVGCCMTCLRIGLTLDFFVHGQSSPLCCILLL
jgi:hypothetical protein